MKTREIKNLVFVYNARSGLGNALLDSAHKFLSPATYNCRLCSLTFGLAGERRSWKEFREQSGIRMTFLHKDEFLSTYASKFGAKYTFPVVVADTGEDLEVVLSATDLNAIGDTEELIRVVSSRMAT